MKSRFIKVGLFAAVAALAFCLTGCSGSNSSSNGEASQASIGESVETDIVKFTLDRAELALALENNGAATVGYGADGLATDDYFMPKEYNPEEDAKNPFVAAKGHALISMTFTTESLDRSYVELCGWGLYELMTVTYNGTSYAGESSADESFKSEIRVMNDDNEGWKGIRTSQIVAKVGEPVSYKVYIDIPVEIEDLSSPFEITVILPTSNGESQPFTYSINQ